MGTSLRAMWARRHARWSSTSSEPHRQAALVAERRDDVALDAPFGAALAAVFGVARVAEVARVARGVGGGPGLAGEVAEEFVARAGVGIAPIGAESAPAVDMLFAGVAGRESCIATSPLREFTRSGAAGGVVALTCSGRSAPERIATRNNAAASRADILRRVYRSASPSGATAERTLAFSSA
jgi:hypothetical protein